MWIETGKQPMGKVFNLKDFRPPLTEKNDEKGRSKTPGKDKVPLVRMSRPRMIIPRLRTHLPRRIDVDPAAGRIITDWQRTHNGSLDAAVWLTLFRLRESKTASLAEVQRFAAGVDSRFATLEEFIGFVIALTPVEEMLDDPIVALGIGHPDEFGNHHGITYEYDRRKNEKRVRLAFAERIREDWLLLLAYIEPKRPKKSTPT